MHEAKTLLISNPEEIPGNPDHREFFLDSHYAATRLHEVPKSPAFPRIEGSLEAPASIGSAELPVPAESHMVLSGARRWFTEKRAGLKPPESVKPEKGTTLVERHPDWPHISASIFFGPHGTFEDMKDLPGQLAGAHILLQEDLEGTMYRKGESAATRIFRKASQGAYGNIEQAIDRLGVRGSSTEALLRGVHGHNLVAGTIDTSLQESKKIGLTKQHAEKDYKNKSFDETVDFVAEELREDSQMQNEREAIMIGRFENEIERILEQFPDLRNKSDLKVVLTLGSYHTRVRHGLEEIGVETDRQFAHQSRPNTHVYDHQSQLARAYAFGREPSRDEKEKAYADRLLFYALGSGVGVRVRHNNAYIEYRRKIVSGLTHEEMRELHATVESNVDSKGLVSKFDEILWRSGKKPLARSEHEMIDLLMADREKEAMARSKALAA